MTSSWACCVSRGWLSSNTRTAPNSGVSSRVVHFGYIIEVSMAAPLCIICACIDHDFDQSCKSGVDYNNLINRYSVAGSTRTVARTVGSDQGQYLVLGKMGGKRGRLMCRSKLRNNDN